MKEENTMKRVVTVEKAVKILNEALEADPVAMNALFNKRVPCNKELGDHKTIQIAKSGVYGLDFESLGAIGIINGIFGIDDESYGAITVRYEANCGCKETPDEVEIGRHCLVCGQIVGFSKILDFIDNGREVKHS